MKVTASIHVRFTSEVSVAAYHSRVVRWSISDVDIVAACIAIEEENFVLAESRGWGYGRAYWFQRRHRSWLSSNRRHGWSWCHTNIFVNTACRPKFSVTARLKTFEIILRAIPASWKVVTIAAHQLAVHAQCIPLTFITCCWCWRRRRGGNWSNWRDGWRGSVAHIIIVTDSIHE